MANNGTKQYTAKEMIKAIRLNKGMVYLAAKSLRCSPQTVYNYIKNYPTVQAAVDSERGLFLDKTELKLDEAIEDGQGWAIAFALKTLGKHRGYTEKQLVQQQTVNLDVDVNTLDDEQLKRLVNGEDLVDILAD